MNKILITGGAGYIGSHTLIELNNAGYEFIVYDNLSNSSEESLKRVEKIMGKNITFVQGDIRDTRGFFKLNQLFILQLARVLNIMIIMLRLLEKNSLW